MLETAKSNLILHLGCIQTARLQRQTLTVGPGAVLELLPRVELSLGALHRLPQQVLGDGGRRAALLLPRRQLQGRLQATRDAHVPGRAGEARESRSSKKRLEVTRKLTIKHRTISIQFKVVSLDLRQFS